MIRKAHQKSNFGELFYVANNKQIISVRVLRKIYLKFIHKVV